MKEQKSVNGRRCHSLPSPSVSGFAIGHNSWEVIFHQQNDKTIFKERISESGDVNTTNSNNYFFL